MAGNNPRNSRFKEDFEVIETIGEGGFGEVYKVLHINEEHHKAIKKVKINQSNRVDWLQREIQVMAKFTHDNIVRFYSSWCEQETVHDEYLYISMEICDMSLRDWFDENILERDYNIQQKFLREMVSGLKYIHSKESMHRDLKPENILILDNTIKISDFGLTKKLNDFDDFGGGKKSFGKDKPSTRHTEDVGTQDYMSPEQLMGRVDYNEKVDIFALGLIVLEMFLLCDSSERKAALRGARKLQFPPAMTGRYETECKLMKSMLQHNARDRPSAEELYKRLSQDENSEAEQLRKQLEEQMASTRRLEEQLSNAVESGYVDEQGAESSTRRGTSRRKVTSRGTRRSTQRGFTSQKGQARHMVDMMAQSLGTVMPPLMEAVFKAKEGVSMSGNQDINRFLNEFDSIEELGRGGFGVVHKARNKIDARSYAVKIITFASKEDLEFSQRELKTLAHFEHPNIVRYRTNWMLTRTVDEHYLYIQMELCQQNLRTWLNNSLQQRNLDEQRDILMQILSAVKYIHQKKYMHRDLKPENIFLLDGTVKVGDLGLIQESHKDLRSQQYQEESDQSDSESTSQSKYTVTEGCGTKYYMSPEQLRRRDDYDAKVDIFALGLIFYEMFVPFPPSRLGEELQKARRHDFPPSFKQENPTECSLIMKILTEDPTERPSAVTLYEALQMHIKFQDRVLLEAAEKNRFEELRLLVNDQVHFDKRNNDGLTVLHIAALKGESNTVENLVKAGADTEATDQDECTALHLAAKNGHISTVQVLLDYKADISWRNKKGETALHQASANGHSDTVKFLLQAHDNPILRRYDEDTALHLAARNDHSETVSVFVEAGHDLTQTDGHGYTALHIATEKQHTATVKILLKKFDGFAMDRDYEYAAFHLACCKGLSEVVKVFIDCGADLTQQDGNGDNALHLAAMNGRSRTVGILIQSGAITEKPNQTGKAAIHLAAGNDHSSTVKVLSKPFLISVNLDLRDSEGYSALHVAARKGFSKTVKELSKLGADLNYNDFNTKTPLHLAAESGFSETVSVLTDHKADLTLVDKNGNSALHLSVLNGNSETTKILLSAGADVTKKKKVPTATLR